MICPWRSKWNLVTVVVRTFDAGVREGIDVTKALDLVAEMDDEHLLAVTARLTAAAAQDDHS